MCNLQCQHFNNIINDVLPLDLSMNVRHIYLTRITSRRVHARCYNGDHRSGEESSLGNNAQECSWQEEEDATAGELDFSAFAAVRVVSLRQRARLVLLSLNTVIPAFIALLMSEFFTCCKRIRRGDSMISFLLELA